MDSATSRSSSSLEQPLPNTMRGKPRAVFTRLATWPPVSALAGELGCFEMPLVHGTKLQLGRFDPAKDGPERKDKIVLSMTDQRGLSRSHGWLECHEGRFLVVWPVTEKEGFPTWVNGEPITSCVTLRTDDVLGFGAISGRPVLEFDVRILNLTMTKVIKPTAAPPTPIHFGLGGRSVSASPDLCAAGQSPNLPSADDELSTDWSPQADDELGADRSGPRSPKKSGVLERAQRQLAEMNRQSSVLERAERQLAEMKLELQEKEAAHEKELTARTSLSNEAAELHEKERSARTRLSTEAAELRGEITILRGFLADEAADQVELPSFSSASSSSSAAQQALFARKPSSAASEPATPFSEPATPAGAASGAPKVDGGSPSPRPSLEELCQLFLHELDIDPSLSAAGCVAAAVEALSVAEQPGATTADVAYSCWRALGSPPLTSRRESNARTPELTTPDWLRTAALTPPATPAARAPAKVVEDETTAKKRAAAAAEKRRSSFDAPTPEWLRTAASTLDEKAAAKAAAEPEEADLPVPPSPSSPLPPSPAPPLPPQRRCHGFAGVKLTGQPSPSEQLSPESELTSITKSAHSFEQGVAAATVLQAHARGAAVRLAVAKHRVKRPVTGWRDSSAHYAEVQAQLDWMERLMRNWRTRYTSAHGHGPEVEVHRRKADDAAGLTRLLKDARAQFRRVGVMVGDLLLQVPDAIGLAPSPLASQDPTKKLRTTSSSRICMALPKLSCLDPPSRYAPASSSKA